MFLNKIANNQDKKSLSSQMRLIRYNYFISLVNNLPKPVNVLDVGGTQEYWQAMGLEDDQIKITLLNLTHQKVTSPNFISEIGDATNLSTYNDNSFDIVFSNSVIEHLFTFENQKKMAKEVCRVGKYHFIQTPNYFFPIEPHFLFPGFQFLPKMLRVLLIKNFNLGHVNKKVNWRDAKNQIDEICLLTEGKMEQLFPEDFLWKENYYGFTKSFVAHNFFKK